MSDTAARVLKTELRPDRRILVISDIHANLPYFKALLKKVGFLQADELVLDGDFLEKGSESLNTLRYIMELYRGGNVYPVLGNCDAYWPENIFRGDESYDEHVLKYIRWRKSGIIWDMCQEAGVDVLSVEKFASCKKQLIDAFYPELCFLDKLPHALETERFVFAHAGMSAAKPPEQQPAREFLRRDAFMNEGQSFKKWVIAGHWPVMLYGENVVCANPVIDREHRIISIDGGCVLKDDGQLNALVIPNRDSEEFSWVSYDPFPVSRVKTDQQASRRSYYIRWGDNRVRVLHRGEEFSRCVHLRTGYEMDILTKYLYTDEEITDCNDCTDYVLPLHAGDTVSIIEKTSRGYFLKHEGYSGWYYGELEL